MLKKSETVNLICQYWKTGKIKSAVFAISNLFAVFRMQNKHKKSGLIFVVAKRNKSFSFTMELFKELKCDIY